MSNRLTRWLLPAPELESGEKVIWHWPAVRWLKNGDIGGTLYLSDRALIFKPHRLNPSRLRTEERCALDGVLDVDLVERTRSREYGGLRRRMRVTWKNGTWTLFTIDKDLDEAITRLREAVSEARLRADGGCVGDGFGFP